MADKNIDTLAGHEVEWWVRDYMGETITDLDECSEEHITAQLIDGYHSGELCILHLPNESLYDGDPVELRGWWNKA